MNELTRLSTEYLATLPLTVRLMHESGKELSGGGYAPLTVNGEAVTGKTYEQVIQMVRGEAGTAVKLGTKGEGGIRELSITRVASETLYKDQKGQMGSHGSPAR